MTESEGNAAVVEQIVDKWVPLAETAIEDYDDAIPESKISTNDEIVAAEKTSRDIMGTK